MSGVRWQYSVANIGAFGARERLSLVLAHMGEQGYELTTVYDKASNWFQGMEKCFMLFKREVPSGSEPVGPWCWVLDVTTLDQSGVAGYGFPENQAW